MRSIWAIEERRGPVSTSRRLPWSVNERRLELELPVWTVLVFCSLQASSHIDSYSLLLVVFVVLIRMKEDGVVLRPKFDLVVESMAAASAAQSRSDPLITSQACLGLRSVFECGFLDDFTCRRFSIRIEF